MEYEELRDLTHKIVKKSVLTGLVGLALTAGAVKAIDNQNLKSAVGVVGLASSVLLPLPYFSYKHRHEYYGSTDDY